MTMYILQSIQMLVLCIISVTSFTIIRSLLFSEYNSTCFIVHSVYYTYCGIVTALCITIFKKSHHPGSNQGPSELQTDALPTELRREE